MLVLLAGCDTVDQITEQAQQAGKSVEQAVEQIDQQVDQTFNLAGNMQLTLTEQVNTPACYVSFIELPTHTGNILQLASYKAPGTEVYPSIFVRADVGSTGSLAELAGQTVQADLFVKTSAQDAAWHALSGAPVELRIGEVTEGQLMAEVSGELTRKNGSESTPVSGTLTAVIQ